MKISHVKHADIDKQKWDRCIENAPNGLIYAYSFYLDAMSKNWDAIIMNDYQAVMPLTGNKKFGIAYLSQPAFTQQSGIFGQFLFDNNLTETFVSKASELFPFAEINLNYANEYKSALTKKCNLILPLHPSFAEIEKSFTSDLIKNIKKAKRNNLIYTASGEIEKALELYKKTYSARLHTSEKDYANFLKLCYVLNKKGQIFVRKINSADGQLLAMAIFLKDQKRIYNIMSTTLPAGRKPGANHFLLYELIKEFSSQNRILDFEGSEIPGIKHFYKNFGSIEQPYPFVRFNKLKKWQRLIKKLNDYYKFSPIKTASFSLLK